MILKAGDRVFYKMRVGIVPRLIPSTILKVTKKGRLFILCDGTSLPRTVMMKSVCERDAEGRKA